MKKRLMLMGLFISMMICAMPVYAKSVNIKDVCDQISSSIDVKLPNMVHTIILVIQIAVPVLLVIFGMIDLFKGMIAQKEDEIKKGQQTFIKRLIAAAIVFFVIVIVKLLIGFVAGNDTDTIMNCANCFINGVNENTGVCKD